MASSEMSSFGSRGERAGELELAHVDLGQAAGVGIGAVAKTHQVQDLARFGLGGAVAVRGRVFHGDQQVLQHGHGAEGRGI